MFSEKMETNKSHEKLIDSIISKWFYRSLMKNEHSLEKQRTIYYPIKKKEEHLFTIELLHIIFFPIIINRY